MSELNRHLIIIARLYDLQELHAGCTVRLCGCVAVHRRLPTFSGFGLPMYEAVDPVSLEGILRACRQWNTHSSSDLAVVVLCLPAAESTIDMQLSAGTSPLTQLHARKGRSTIRPGWRSPNNALSLLHCRPAERSLRLWRLSAAAI